ncbi:MAG TPA: YkvA family protein [Gemmatimonadota bacterium]|nr:YkvA family protein [Gemmatimonadota bacterium]
MSARDLRPLDETPAAPEPSRSSARETLKELALFLPNFVVLLRRLLADPRVPRKSKLILGGTVLYLVSPLDVVPDFVPGLGQLDDVVVALLALHSILNRVDDEVVVEHWPGDENVIRMVRAGLSAVAQLLPGKWESRV